MTDQGKQKVANALSWATVVGVLAVLWGIALSLGCVSISIKRPETAQALYFSNEVVRSAAYGIAFGVVIDDLKDIEKPTDKKAQEWAKRADFLLVCGEILTATESEANPSLTEDQLDQLRQVILAFQYQEKKGDNWKAVLNMVPWWAVFREMDPRDRAQLSSFCVYAADGIRVAWAETKSKKGW